MNHQDIVQRIHDAEPASTWQSADGMLGFVLRVIAALPPTEQAGLVNAPPGGENVAHYAPADRWVRVNRVMSPNGQIIKILTNSGVGGENGPAWNEDDIRPDLYVAVTPTEPVPDAPPPPDTSALEARVAELERAVQSVTIRQQADADAQAGLIADLQRRASDLEARPVPAPYVLPPLVAIGKIPFYGTFRLPVQKA